MMENETEILTGQRELKIGAEKIIVRELRWSEALEFLKRLGSHIGKLFVVDAAGRIHTDLSADKLGEIIISSADLVAFLVEKSVSRSGPIPAPLQAGPGGDQGVGAWFSSLPMSDALTVLDTALALNLSEDLLKKVGALGRRIGAVLPGAKVAGSEKSTTT